MPPNNQQIQSLNESIKKVNAMLPGLSKQYNNAELTRLPTLPETESNIRSVSAVNSNDARRDMNSMIGDITEASKRTVPVQDDRSSIQEALASLESTSKSTLSGFQDQLASLSKNGITYSEDEQRVLDDIRERFDMLSRRQMVANQSLEGGFATTQARSGLARYGAEMAEIEMYGVVSTGIEKLKEIELQATQALQEARDAIRAGRIDEIKASYKLYEDNIKDRRDTLNTMRLNLNDYESNMNALSRLEIDTNKFGLDQEKFGLDELRFKLDEKKYASDAQYRNAVLALRQQEINNKKDEDNDPYGSLFGEDTGEISSELKSMIESRFTRNQISTLAQTLGIVKKVNLRGKKFDEKKFYEDLGKIAQQAYDAGLSDEEIVDGFYSLLNPETEE